MLATLRQHWKDFKKSPPGRRFQDIHKRREKQGGKGAAVKKWALIILGTAVTLAGIFFLAVPGPGMLVLAIGLIMIAGESKTMARFLDWSELKIRPAYEAGKKWWKAASGKTRVALSLTASAAGFAAAAAAYYFFMMK